MLMPAQAKTNKQKVTFYVYLHCDGCVNKVMKNIAYEKGVKDLECSIENQTVVVTYDANKTDIPTLQKAFAKIGKPATLTKPSETKTDANTSATIQHEHEEHHGHDHKDHDHSHHEHH